MQTQKARVKQLSRPLLFKIKIKSVFLPYLFFSSVVLVAYNLICWLFDGRLDI